MSGISICISAEHMSGVAAEGTPSVVISAISLPSLSIPTEGQSAASLLTPGVYSVSEGSISSQTAEGRLNGGPYSPAAMTVPLSVSDVLGVRETVTASGGQTTVFTTNSVTVAAIPPTVTVTIDQPSVDFGNVLGGDVTAQTQITQPGSPALSVDDITLTWRVNTVPAGDGSVLTFGDTVHAVANWNHPAGNDVIVSDGLTVPAAQSPELSVGLAQTAYAVGAVLTFDDIQPVILTMGYPTLIAEDVDVALEVNGSSVVLPYTVQSGDILVPLAMALHPTGTLSARGTFVTATSTFSVSETGGATIEIDGVTGDLTVTVTEPVALAGAYEQDVDGNALNPANLASGPQWFVALSIADDGTPASGETLTGTEGIYIFDADNPAPVLTHQWQRDGVDIPGANSADYTLVAADEGTTITRVDTATQSGTGARSATSNGIAVPSSSNLSVTFVDEAYLDTSGSSFTVMASVPVVSGRDYVALVTARLQSVNTIGNMSLGTVQSAATSQDASAGSDNHIAGVWEFTANTTGNVALTVDDANATVQNISVVLYEVVDGQIKGTPSYVSFTGTKEPAHNQNLVNGETLLVGLGWRSSATAAVDFVPTGYTATAASPTMSENRRWGAFGQHNAVATETPRVVSTQLANAGQGTPNGGIVMNVVVEAV